MTDQPIQVPTVWVGLEDVDVRMANLFSLQVSAPNELILNIGQVAPPMLVGTPEEQVTQAKAVAFVQVRTIARLGLTPHRAREIMGILQQVLEVHDRTFGGARS